MPNKMQSSKQLIVKQKQKSDAKFEKQLQTWE